MYLLGSTHLAASVRLAATSTPAAAAAAAAALDAWRDGLDAVWSTLDVVDNWAAAVLPDEASADATAAAATLARLGAAGCLLTAVLCHAATSASAWLATLLDAGGAGGGDARARAAVLTERQTVQLHLLAAFCVRASWGGAAAHPARNIDFSRYRPASWLPGLDVFVDDRMLPPPHLAAALRSCIAGLLAHGSAFAERALPVAAALEHVAVLRLGDVAAIVDAKLLRVAAQCAVGDLEGAVDTLAGVYRGVDCPTSAWVAPPPTPASSPAASPTVPALPLGGSSADGKKAGAGGPAAAAAAATTTTAAAGAKRGAAAGGGGDGAAGAGGVRRTGGAVETLVATRPAGALARLAGHLPPNHPANKDALAWLAAPADDARLALPPALARACPPSTLANLQVARARICRLLAASAPAAAEHATAMAGVGEPPAAVAAASRLVTNLYHALVLAAEPTLLAGRSGVAALADAAVAAGAATATDIAPPYASGGGADGGAAPAGAGTGAGGWAADAAWREGLLAGSRAILSGALRGELGAAAHLSHPAQVALYGSPDGTLPEGHAQGGAAAAPAPPTRPPSPSRPNSSSGKGRPGAPAPIANPRPPAAASPAAGAAGGEGGSSVREPAWASTAAAAALVAEASALAEVALDARGALALAGEAQRLLAAAAAGVRALPALGDALSSPPLALPVVDVSTTTWLALRRRAGVALVRLGSAAEAARLLVVASEEARAAGDDLAARRLSVTAAVALLADGEVEAAGERLAAVVADAADRAALCVAAAYVGSPVYDVVGLPDGETVAEAACLLAAVVEAGSAPPPAVTAAAAAAAAPLRAALARAAPALARDSGTDTAALLRATAHAIFLQRLHATSIDAVPWVHAGVGLGCGGIALPLAGARAGTDTLYNPYARSYVQACLARAGGSGSPGGRLATAAAALAAAAHLLPCTPPGLLADACTAVGDAAAASGLSAPAGAAALLLAASELHLRVAAAAAGTRGWLGTPSVAAALAGLAGLTRDVARLGTLAPLGRAAPVAAVAAAGALASCRRWRTGGVLHAASGHAGLNTDGSGQGGDGSGASGGVGAAKGKAASGSGKEKEAAAAAAAAAAALPVNTDSWIPRWARALPAGMIGEVRAARRAEARAAGAAKQAADGAGLAASEAGGDVGIAGMAVANGMAAAAAASGPWGGVNHVWSPWGDAAAAAWLRAVTEVVPAALPSPPDACALLALAAPPPPSGDAPASAASVRGVVHCVLDAPPPPSGGPLPTAVVCSLVAASVTGGDGGRVSVDIIVGPAPPTTATPSGAGGAPPATTAPPAGAPVAATAASPAASGSRPSSSSSTTRGGAPVAPAAAAPVSAPAPAPPRVAMPSGPRAPDATKDIALVTPTGIPADALEGTLGEVTGAWRALRMVCDPAYAAACGIVTEGDAPASGASAVASTTGAPPAGGGGSGPRISSAGGNTAKGASGASAAPPPPPAYVGPAVDVAAGGERTARTALRTLLALLAAGLPAGTGASSASDVVDAALATLLSGEANGAAAAAGATGASGSGAAAAVAPAKGSGGAKGGHAAGAAAGAVPPPTGGAPPPGSTAAAAAAAAALVFDADAPPGAEGSSSRATLAALEAVVRTFRDGEAVRSGPLAAALRVLLLTGEQSL